MAELVHTWYEANKEKRSLIMMVGEEEANGLAHTLMIAGRHYSILAMFMEFIEEQASLVEEAALFTSFKEMKSKLGKKENRDSKNRKS